MLVALYTSRIVLDALGIEDFGIWSVLGGVITIFGFINQSLSASIFRYITHAIGTGDKEQINRTYSCSITIHAALAVIIFLLCETAGQWLLADKLVIPEEKRDIAETVFHIAAATGSISLLTVPFSSVIIAREQMHVFAYLSIAETLLKLAIAAAVYMAPARKLIWYAAMMLAAFLYLPVTQLMASGTPITIGAIDALLTGELLVRAQTFAFTVLAVSQLWHSLGMRDVDTSIFVTIRHENKLTLLSFFGGLLLQICATEIPLFAGIFGTATLAFAEWLGLIIFSMLPLLFHEIFIPFRRALHIGERG